MDPPSGYSDRSFGSDILVLVLDGTMIPRFLSRWCAATLGFIALTGQDAQSANPVRPVYREVSARMTALEFTSDHNLICRDGSDLLRCGSRYPDVEWSAKEPHFASPMTHTQGRYVEARVMVKLNRLPAGTMVRLKGTAEQESFTFEGEGKVEDVGGDPCMAVVYVRSKGMLPAQLRRMQATIDWSVTVLVPGDSPRVIDLADTGPHVCYLTRGTPRRADEVASAVTPRRMQTSYERLALALESVEEENPSTIAIVHALTRHVGEHYNPKQHFEREDAWYVPTTWRLKPAGASCISICNYCSLILDQIGMEGEYRQIALYSRPDNPDRALEGGRESDSITRDVGRQQWELFLVDDRNTRQGQVGGWGGMNYYEAVIAYDYKGKTYYFPGGTDRVYDNKDQVLKIFRTLAWARWDTWRKEWQVMQVVRTYTSPGRGAPPNCELP